MRPIIVAFLVITAVPLSAASAVDRIVTLTPGHPFAGAIRIGTAVGGPSLRNVVPPDVAELVFKSASDNRPANAWFAGAYEAALRANGFLAKAPALAPYRLDAEVSALAIRPMETGSHHSSVVTYRLVDVATGRQVWSETQRIDFDVRRGFRFGKIGGVIGLAVAGALVGQNPALTSYQMTDYRKRARPFDTRIDVYEGLLRGFQLMARESMKSLALGPAPAGSPAQIAASAAPAPDAGQAGQTRPAPQVVAASLERKRTVTVIPENGLIDVPFEDQ
jgi:hypothetical protein